MNEYSLKAKNYLYDGSKAVSLALDFSLTGGLIKGYLADMTETYKQDPKSNIKGKVMDGNLSFQWHGFDHKFI
jgi:hypothetical protein